jgi:hypothetical protein
MASIGLARELWHQLQGIAGARGLAKVTRADMTIGELHGFPAGELEDDFERSFAGTLFAGAAVNVTVVSIGQSYTPPGEQQSVEANGWELLITLIEGHE